MAGLAGSALGAAANLLSGKTRNAVPLVVLSGLCVVALWLLRRGRARAAALVLLAALLGSVHAMLMMGQGVHDRAALLYPVIILVAALLLDRRLLVATTALCVLSVTVVVRLEQSGVLRTPFSGLLGWLPVVDMTIVFVVTAVAVHLLVADVVRGPPRCAPRASAWRRRTDSSRRGAPSWSASPTWCPTTSRARW